MLYLKRTLIEIQGKETQKSHEHGKEVTTIEKSQGKRKSVYWNQMVNLFSVHILKCTT